jgi:hypothetical protein
VRRTTIAWWVKFAGTCELPVPPTIPVRPISWTETRFRTVDPAVTVGMTRALQRRDSVCWGERFSDQVRIVFAPLTTGPGLPAAQPVGVIVHPTHESSKPKPGPHTSMPAGTVSHMSTFHQVFEVEMFLMKIS